MGVYIPKVEIADNCLDCCFNYDQLFCMPLDRKTPDVGKPDWCPLVEVPEPLGRLIDADALLEKLTPRWMPKDVWEESSAYKDIANAPTIIERRE